MITGLRECKGLFQWEYAPALMQDRLQYQLVRQPRYTHRLHEDERAQFPHRRRDLFRSEDGYGLRRAPFDHACFLAVCAPQSMRFRTRWQVRIQSLFALAAQG